MALNINQSTLYYVASIFFLHVIYQARRVALGKNRAKKYNHYSKRCAERVKNIARLYHYKERLVLSYKLESKEAILTDTEKHIGINSCDEMSWLRSIDTY
jgi:hypothetical protein